MGLLLPVLEHTPAPGASQGDKEDHLQVDEEHPHTTTSSSCCSSSSSSSSSADDDDHGSTKNKNRGGGGGNSQSFPWQLHSMLEAAANEGFDHIVSWLDDNASFKVLEPALFVQQVMPRFFERQSKYKSFQRQLNIWQFERLVGSRGPCNGGYCHVHFHRTQTSQFHLIKRLKKLGKCRHPSSPSSSSYEQEQSHLRRSLEECLQLVQTAAPQYQRRTRTMFGNTSTGSSVITDLGGLGVSQKHQGAVLLNPPLRHDTTQLELYDTSRIMTSNPPSKIKAIRCGGNSSSRVLGIDASIVQPTTTGINVNVHSSKPQLEIDTTLGKTVVFFSSSASMNVNVVPPQQGIKHRAQDAQQSCMSTSSKTNHDVSGCSNDGNTKLLSRMDAETFRQVFPRFTCCSDDDDNRTKKNVVLDADQDELLQALNPKNEATRHQEGPGMIISEDEWKYVLIGWRIGASMAVS